jgi:hypothetical protein
MLIDSNTGNMHLPSGFVITSAMTQTEFQNTPWSKKAKARDVGTFPYIHYSFDGGLIQGKKLLMSICFYAEKILYISLTVDLYPPGERDWDSYSLETEAETKEFHDTLLKIELGEPHIKDALELGSPSIPKTLNQPVRYTYEWGEVYSGHDTKGGGTRIMVSYGRRREEAAEDYRRSKQNV